MGGYGQDQIDKLAKKQTYFEENVKFTIFLHKCVEIRFDLKIQ